MRICLLAMLASISAFGAEEIDLAGVWRLSQADDPSVSCPAMVPGGNYAALIHAGVIPEPYFAMNEYLVQWPRTKGWVFSRDFEVPAEILARRNKILRFEGVDLFAAVVLNGREIGRTRDRFVRYDFDASGVLRAGRNSLEIRFASTEKKAVEEAGRYRSFYPQGAPLKVAYLNYLRTVLCKSGWDWGITLMDTGVMDKVSLVVSDSPRIDYIYSTQAFAKDYSHCTLEVFADLSDGTVVTNRVEIEHPPLWWPNGYGPQNFYTYSINVRGENVTRKIGLRKLEVNRSGGALEFVVNGVPVFAKGANWIPVDAIETRQTPDRYRWLLESAAKANMNMIRVWGGGKFEKDVFYDLCDELGLLVWQDFPFAGAVFPEEDIFYAQIGPEIRHQLKRLRDHASVALWSGDNECVNTCVDFADELKESVEGSFLVNAVKRESFLTRLVSEYDPTRLFWPSSPCPGPGATEKGRLQGDESGDCHVWSVWFDECTGDHYHSHHPRFCSEFGFQSLMSEQTAERWLPEGRRKPQDKNFRYHEKCAHGNERIAAMMERTFVVRKGMGAEQYLSQALQADVVCTGIRAWRAQSPRCRGSLYWQLNDNWPVSSWSSIEYSGQWKQLHYQARRAYAPVAVIPVPRAAGTNIDFVVANDTRTELRGELRTRLLDFRGKVLALKSYAVAVPSGLSVSVASATRLSFGSEDELPNRFVCLELLRQETCVAEGFHFFAPYRDCSLESPTIRIDFANDHLAVELSTDVPAFFIWLDVQGKLGVFSDNSFVLLPGHPKMLSFDPIEPISVKEFRDALSVRHLRQTY